MDKNFHDPIAPKPTKHKIKNPWNFQAPQYDERSSCYVDAGTHYGIGYKSPVGHEGNPKERASTLPYGRVPTMQTDEMPRRLLNPDMEE